MHTEFQLPWFPGSRNASVRLNPIYLFYFYLFILGGVDFFVHLSSSWVKISLYSEFQLPRLPGSRTGFFSRLNPIWVEIRWHAKFQLPRLPGSGSFMVGEATTGNN